MTDRLSDQVTGPMMDPVINPAIDPISSRSNGPSTGTRSPHQGAKLRGLGVLAVVFLAGGTGGFALARAVSPPAPAAVTMEAAGPEVVSMEAAGPGTLPPPLLDELGATAEQRAAIERIVERYRPRTEALLRQTFPALRAITDSVDREIRAVLTPEQRAKLDRLRIHPEVVPAPTAPGQRAVPGWAPVLPPPSENDSAAKSPRLLGPPDRT